MDIELFLKSFLMSNHLIPVFKEDMVATLIKYIFFVKIVNANQ